ncbi:MAG TPA: DUF2125 domain-containing protein [Patescibacteria group bacterium]|jgi:hypothetical protein|nr:DUF2125 domain-containing protein [Patescibacteria group bacterium]
MKMGKTRQAIIAAGLLAVFLYCGAWFAGAAVIRKQIHRLPELAARSGIEIDGQFSDVSGFPFQPNVHFAGSLRAPQATVIIPELFVQGFPLPGRQVKLVLPQGAHLEPGIDRNYIDSDLWSAQFMSATAIIPDPLPVDGTAEGLAEWRDRDGKITLNSVTVKKNSLDLRGRGVLKLDSNLQPDGQIHADVIGYDDFMAYLAAKNLVKRKQGFLAQTALSLFARRDPVSKQSSISADLAIQRQSLYFGPILLATMPAVQWPHR